MDIEFDPCKKLLPDIVDHRASLLPDAVYAEYPNSPLDYREGYRKITYRDLANAINGIAHWLTMSLGPGSSSEILLYIGPNDIRYPALVVGAIKAGYSIFLTSPRNSIAAHESLLNKLKCKKIVTSKPHPPAVTAILDAIDLQVLEVPSVDELLENQHSPFPFKKSLDTNALETLVVIHTSGSTGIPKPIVVTHDVAARSMKMIRLRPPDGFESLDRMTQGLRMFMTFPPFHAAYVVSHLFNAIPFDTTMVSPATAAIPSAAGMVEGMKKTPVDLAFTTPSIIQELAQSPQLLDYCGQNLKLLMYAGGDLPQELGERVAGRIKLVNQYGATELGLLPMLFSKSNRDPEDWKYIEIHPDMGVEFRPITDGQHELVSVRSSTLEQNQPTYAYGGFTELQEYRSRDLFIQHPDPKKRNLWKWHARLDDILVFLNGEKTNPVSMEQQILSRNPQVTGVLVIGAQRFQAALLVETENDTNELLSSSQIDLFDAIWPSIEDANKECPAHARITRSHVLFTSPDKPMLRTGKGTIQRAGTLKLYEKEIDSLYRDAETFALDTSKDVEPEFAKNADRCAASQFIKSTVLAITQWSKLNDTDNIFIRGMDSLQAITAVRTLRRGFQTNAIDAQMIYTNPSVIDLTDAIMQFNEDESANAKVENEKRLLERQNMLNMFHDKIDQIPKPSVSHMSTDKHQVILTGSTGVLGTYLLHDLLASESVEYVYCLNRRENSRELQMNSNKIRHLDTKLNSRVAFLTVDLSKDRFGLPAEIFQTLLETTTIVIHNAWPVNFNMSLSYFEPQLSGLVNLISFCASATKLPSLFFVSSASSVSNYSTGSRTTPEEVVISDSPALNGYAESKYLAEQLLDHAAKRLCIPLAFARVGQLAGAIKRPGLWNPDEWFPSLFLSSLHIGAIPDTLGLVMGHIDWVPVDMISVVLIELALRQTSNFAPGVVEVFHPLNLQPQTWASLLPTLILEIEKTLGTTLKIIPLCEWISRVRQDMEKNQATGKENLRVLLKTNPAAKLLDFFEGLDTENKAQNVALQGHCYNVLETTRTRMKSHGLRAVPTVKVEWFSKWASEWIRR